MKPVSILTFCVAAAGLAGCTGSTDPSEAGLFDNIRNINTGEYDRQIAQNEAEAARITRENQARQSSINSLNRQKASNASTISSLRREIAALQSQLSSLRADAGSDAGKLAQINQLENQLVEVRSDANNGASAGIVRAELGRIRSAVRALSS
ncbi:hypothetical protein [Litoreibacter roseus]|uniref:Lipoprotein n=1 Tax=Litoreibacter roseus TaxID=2601869 RepID=A0A6N6JD90_9RHOB|nr:hypothetical protein [Litoreibacter roseus]GFE64084.1 hypothetical protein KIN_11580 [Litoreibacter roseus]